MLNKATRQVIMSFQRIVHLRVFPNDKAYPSMSLFRFSFPLRLHTQSHTKRHLKLPSEITVSTSSPLHQALYLAHCMKRALLLTTLPTLTLRVIAQLHWELRLNTETDQNTVGRAHRRFSHSTKKRAAGLGGTTTPAHCLKCPPNKGLAGSLGG